MRYSISFERSLSEDGECLDRRTEETEEARAREQLQAELDEQLLPEIVVELGAVEITPGTDAYRVDGTIEMNDVRLWLRKQLQNAYDNGVAGRFLIRGPYEIPDHA